MTKFTAFVIIVALRIVYHPSDARKDIAPFASPSPLPASTLSIAPAKPITINGSTSNHKVILNRFVGENQTAGLFEVEKCTDGKTITGTLIINGTDKPGTDNYRFYEPAVLKKVLYRISQVKKNQQVEYSAVIEVNPNV